jgi:hypothetical protein
MTVKALVVARSSENFSTLYNDEGSSADCNVQFWKVKPPKGYLPCGDVCEASPSGWIYGSNPPRGQVIVLAPDGTSTDLANPTDFRLLWTDAGSGATLNGSVWEMIVPTGFVALGVKGKVTLLENSKTSTTRDLDVLRVDQRKWYESIQELRRWYKQDTAAVRDMFCKIPESPGDSAEGDAYAAKLAEIANRMRDDVQPRWQAVQRDGDALVARADRLMNEQDDEVQKGAQRTAKEVTGVMASLQNLLDNELKGANDPEFRARMETGKNEHNRIQADSSKCTAKELTFGSRRVDCIRVSGSTCYVVEIKPNNDAAQRRGKEQIESGIKEIIKAFEGKKKREELKDRLEVFRPCFDEVKQSVKLEPELRVYEYCPPEGEMYKDFVVNLPQ